MTKSQYCKRIRKISTYIKKWILKQPEVKEESLTDWLLFQMSEKVPNIISKSFTRYQEARTTGADWEWWFLFPNNKYYKIRIQAKKMHDDNYSCIAYKNKYGLQIEKLLKDAVSSNSIPFYVFYSSISGKTMCNMNVNNEGVFLIGANEIYISFMSNGKVIVKPNDLIKISNVLSCFFCCPLIGQSDFQKFIEYYYKHENCGDIEKSIKEDSEKNTDLPLGMHERLPDYVLNLIKNKDGNISYYEEEFKSKIDGINALLICDYREIKFKEESF